MWASRVVRLVLVALASAVMSGSPSSADATRPDRDEGLRLYEAGRWAEAIPHLDRVLERHPRDLEVHIRRGACYLRLDEPARALADFAFVNQFDPFNQFPDSAGNQGIALLMLGRDQEALQSFQYAAFLWSLPENWPTAVGARDRAKVIRSRAGAYEGMAQAYHRLGLDGPALAAYNQAMAIDPTTPNAFAGRGDVLAGQRRYDEAIADYTQAIQRDPGHSRAYAGRGIVLYERGRDEAAVADLDQAIRLDPRFARAYSYRGAARARLGRNEPALADYDALIKLMPENAGAYKDRGGVLYRLGRYDRAVRDLDEAIRLDPGRAAAYQNRGAARNALGLYTQAIDDLDEAIRLDPENAGAYSNRGQARYALGEYDRAIDDLGRAIAIQPQNALIYFNRAETFARLGKTEPALADYREAIRLEPRLAAAFAAIGRIESQLGRCDEAIRDFDMALQLDPDRMGGIVYRDRGDAHRASGDWAGAVADYDRAVSLNPRQAELYLSRGWARLGAGVDGADRDAHAYLALRGWHDALSPYMALLAVLGAQGAPREAEARRALDEAVVNRPRRSWPSPILHYFHGELGEAGLLGDAESPRERAEAHLFIGLHRLRSGDRASALAHLQSAADRESPGSIAADLARAVLGRITSSGGGGDASR